MKRFLRHTATKTAAALLASVFLMLSVFSVLGISALLKRHAYGKSFGELEKEIWEESSVQIARNVAQQYFDYTQGAYMLTELHGDVNAYCKETDTSVVLRNENDSILFSTVREGMHKYQVKERFTFSVFHAYPDYTLSESNGYPDHTATRQELLQSDSQGETLRYVYSVTVYGYSLPDGHPGYDMRTLFSVLYFWRNVLPYVAGVGFVLFLCLSVYLLSFAGKRADREDYAPDWFDRVPMELLLAAFALSAIAWLFVADWVKNLAELVLLLSLSPVPVLLGLLCGISLAARLRMKNLAQSFLSVRVGKFVFRFLKKALSQVRLVPKVAGALALVALLDGALVLGFGTKVFLLVVLVEGVTLSVLLVWYSASLCRLQGDLNRLAEGKLDHRAEIASLPESLRFMGEAVNRSAEGLERAVEEKMKSERLKTELITNVSHDLKTPLTSIVSFVDLMKKEKTRSKKMQEYIEVLDRQSAKLKKLTEDLLESAKASSGTLATAPELLEVNLFMEQALEEYRALFEEKGLVPVLDLCQGEALIFADGKHLWRIAENLLGNVAKYALSGTRVFLMTKVDQDKVQLSFCNISAVPLERSAEELTERFVRGDLSRNTEGSGLGLAIAQSLTELQKGEMRIQTEADLFKVTVTFPRCADERKGDSE